MFNGYWSDVWKKEQKISSWNLFSYQMWTSLGHIYSDPEPFWRFEFRIKFGFSIFKKKKGLKFDLLWILNLGSSTNILVIWISKVGRFEEALKSQRLENLADSCRRSEENLISIKKFEDLNKVEKFWRTWKRYRGSWGWKRFESSKDLEEIWKRRRFWTSAFSLTYLDMK